MNTYPNCSSNSHAAFCSHCGARMVAIPKKQDKAGPIVRLFITAVIAISFIALIAWSAIERGMSVTPLEVLGTIGAGCLCSAWIMSIVRVCIILFPRMIRLANAVCSRLVALSLWGLLIKLFIRLGILLIPVQAFILSIGAIVSLITPLIDDPSNVLAVSLFTLIGVAGMIAIMIPDVRRLKRQA